MRPVNSWRPTSWENGFEVVRKQPLMCDTGDVFELGADKMLQTISTELKKKNVDLAYLLGQVTASKINAP